MPRRLRDEDVRREIDLNEVAEALRARQVEQVEEEQLPVHVPDGDIFETPPVPEREVPVPVNPLYERQASLGLHTPSVALVGAGGVGCWVALSLILGGVTDLTIFDGDTLSIHNLNRFPLGEGSIGELKSVALARWLRTLRPKAEIQARGEWDVELHATPVMEWMVCATDSLKSRRMCYEHAMVAGIKYLEVGADGERWGLSPSPPEFSTDLEDQPGYQTVPVHVGPCMMAGAAAAYYVLHDSKPIFSHSCDWAKGPIIRAYPNLGGLKFESMDEREGEANHNPMIRCPECGVSMEKELILVIKHMREHFPNWGLAEAKAHVEGMFAEVEEGERLLEEVGDVSVLDGTPLEEGLEEEEAQNG